MIFSRIIFCNDRSENVDMFMGRYVYVNLPKSFARFLILSIIVSSMLAKTSQPHGKIVPFGLKPFPQACLLRKKCVHITISTRHNKGVLTVKIKQTMTNLFIFKIVHRIIRIDDKISLLPVLHNCPFLCEVSHFQWIFKAVRLNRKNAHIMSHSLFFFVKNIIFTMYFLPGSSGKKLCFFSQKHFEEKLHKS